MAMRFRARQHLRRKADFAAMRSEGQRQFGPAFVFSFRRRKPVEGCNLPRFSVVASRRTGRAVVRNRLKRRLRELFRLHQQKLPPDVDVIVTLRPGAAAFSFDDLERHFVAAIRRAAPSDPSASDGRDE